LEALRLREVGDALPDLPPVEPDREVAPDLEPLFFEAELPDFEAPDLEDELLFFVAVLGITYFIFLVSYKNGFEKAKTLCQYE
jgi:hypothetical protein